MLLPLKLNNITFFKVVCPSNMDFTNIEPLIGPEFPKFSNHSTVVST